ncbi:MAG: hypothetical protein EOP86_06475 [Verrucomicrobiaceae bacterium]|nr:MAG: hypothetical protein EOP86_06475 [Verrucomicrobiaceae bacterium]
MIPRSATFRAAVSATALLCSATACLLPCPVHAQAASDSAKLESHPATKVVRDYLQLMLQREWAKSAALVEPASLKQLVEDYVKRLKGAPTMDDEAEMTRRVGKSTIEEVAAMSPVEFYVAYHQGIQQRYQVPPEVIKKVRDSLSLRVLSLAQEDESHVHILVRTKHSNDKATFESLELVSLVKVGDVWKVGLNEQAPRMTPLGAAGGAAAADKPAETPKPATPPKGKGKAK